MPGWEPTGALVRGVVVGLLGLGGAVVWGEPALLLLSLGPLLVAVAGVVRRPGRTPRVWASLGHGLLREGHGAELTLHVADGDDVEQVTRVVKPTAYEDVSPHDGRLSVRREDLDRLQLVVSPRRWGARTVGEEEVGCFSPWGGYRCGPVDVPGGILRVIPRSTYRSRAEAPHPKGLVGAHRSQQVGIGTELSGIRAFQPGDRLRRINWRVSVRTGDLHVTTTRAEQDAGLLLVVDLFGEHGRSGGVDGPESSLDLTVRAAASLAEHAVGTGDRVALRPIGGRARGVAMGAGQHHLRRLLSALTEVRTGSSHEEVGRLELRVGAGATVAMLSPLLVDAISTTAVDLARRGVPVVVIDTLPPEGGAPDPGDADPGLVDLAWRMRVLEREHVLHALAAAGCPVVPWRGTGSVDEVLRRLARRRPGGAA